MIQPKIKNTIPTTFENAIKEELFEKYYIEDNPIESISIKNITFNECYFKNISFHNIDINNVDVLDVIFENCDLSNISFVSFILYISAYLITVSPTFSPDFKVFIFISSL